MEAYEITLKLTVQYLKDNSPVTVVVAANKWLPFLSTTFWTNPEKETHF